MSEIIEVGTVYKLLFQHKLSTLQIVYIGHSTDFDKRCKVHLCASGLNIHTKKWSFLKINHDVSEFDITCIPLKEYTNISLIDLKKHEDFYINEFKNNLEYTVLNKNKAYCTIEEKRKKCRIYCKIYYQKNIEKIKKHNT